MRMKVPIVREYPEENQLSLPGWLSMSREYLIMC
jgi:hypothetical protein